MSEGITCCHCGATLRSNGHPAGFRSVACPTCEKQIEIPAAITSGQRPAAPPIQIQLNQTPTTQDHRTGGTASIFAWLLTESRLVYLETKQLLRRTFRYLAGAKDSFHAKVELKHAQVKLGEELASMGLGDAQVQAELSKITTEIETERLSRERETGGDAPNRLKELESMRPMLDKQADLFARLGKLYLAENQHTTVSEIEPHFDTARRCETRLNEQHDELQRQKKALLATDSATNTRAVIGVVGIVLLSVFIFKGSSLLLRLSTATFAYAWSALSSDEDDTISRSDGAPKNDGRSDHAQSEQGNEQKVWEAVRVAIARGDRYRESGELQKAVVAYQEAFEMQPSSAFAFNGNGQVSMLLEQWNDAYEFFSKAIRVNDRFTVAYVNRARCSLVVGEYRQAVKDLDKAVQLDPTKAEIYSFRSQAHRELKDYTAAIRDAETAMRMDTNLAEPYFNRGWIKSLNPETLDDAINDLTIAVKKDPRLALAYHLRGTLYNKREEQGLAFEDFTRAIKANPKLSAAYSSRALLAAIRNDHRQAIEDFTELLKSDLSEEVELKYLLARGESYNALREYSKAIRDFDRVLDKRPKSVEALQNRMVAKEQSGDSAGAKNDADQVASLTHKPESRDSLFSNVRLPSTYSGGYSSSGNADYYRQRAMENAHYEAQRAMNEYRQHTAGNLGAMGIYFQ